jgi:hypothetical protein
MRWGVVVVVILSFVVGVDGGSARITAAGQSTRQAPASAPLDRAWAAVVEQLAGFLSDSDAEGLASLLSDTVVIQSFEHRLSDPLRFLGRARKAELVSCHTYAHPGMSIASDVAHDLRSARIPDEVRRRLALRDERHARRANSIADDWVSAALDAKAGDTVTVMVFWRERGDAEARAEGARSELLWVLLKASTPPAPAGPEDAAAAPRIQHIAFGDPQRPAR